MRAQKRLGSIQRQPRVERAGEDQNPPLRLEFRPGAVRTPASDALRDGAAVAHGHRERHTPRRLVRAHHLTRRRGAGAQRERHAVPGEERERAAGRAPLRDALAETGFFDSVRLVQLAVERVDAERRQADAVRRAQPGDGAAGGGGVLLERVRDGA